MVSLGAHFTDLQLDAAAVGNGTSLSVDQGGGAILVVTGTFVATIVPEVTIDGTNWFSVEAQGLSTGTKVTSITATGSFIVAAPGAVSVRARISAYTSGTVTVQGRKVVVALILPTGGGAAGGATEATLATRLSEADFDTKTGSLTEAAPATDTASSGLNGRLQRIAQRLTSLIALLPSALSALGNLKVTIAEAGTATPVSQSGAPWGVNPTGETAGVGVGAAADLSTSNSVIGRLKALIALLPAALAGGRLDVNLGAAPAVVTVQGNQPARTTGTIISAASTITVTAADKLNVATVTVNGTYAGVSFVVEGSDDGGTTWYGLQAIDNALGQILQTITPGTNATKSYDVTLGGYNQFRVRATAWTSGTANVGISLQAMPYEGTPGALIGDGTNGPATVKPGSTAAVAADKPLVVALHPTTPLPAGAAVIGALTANQSVNVAQVAGSATPTGEGTAATVGTQRHVLGTLAGTSSAPHANVSLGQSTGKTNQLKTGTLATVATTADQVVLTFTVTAGKTFYLEYLTVEVYFTAISATATLLGNWSLETPSGTKVITEQAVNPTTSQPYQFQITFPEPIPVAAAVVVRVVCTPATVTSITWRANFGGYEK